MFRYLGYSCYEVAFGDEVLLLDAYYDGSRPLGTRKVGLTASDIVRAEAILIGHPHGDHIQDAPEISRRTGAKILVSPPGRAFLAKAKVPSDHVTYVHGGETITMRGYTVQTALAVHAEWEPAMTIKATELGAVTADPPLTTEELRRINDSRGKASTLAPGQTASNPETDVINHGTISYVVTLANGFRFMFRDSPGRIGQGERALTDAIRDSGGRIDVGIIGWTGPRPRTGMKYTLPLIELYRPRIYLPAHHDEVGGPRDGLWAEMPTFPLFLTLREQFADIKGVAPLYRSPVCVNMKSRELYHGEWVR